MSEAAEKKPKRARKEKPPGRDMAAEIRPDGGWATDEPPLAAEVGIKVAAGLLRTLKNLVPTYEDADGKKRHRDIPVVGGAMYVGSDIGHFMAEVRLNLGEFCNRKSHVRDAMALAGGSLSATLNYGRLNPWLKTHARGLSRASVGPDGLRMAVAEGLVEMNARPTRQGEQYAGAVRATIEGRVLDSLLLGGPFPLPGMAPGEGGTAVLAVYADRAEVIGRLAGGLPGAPSQLRLKPAALPAGEARCWAYADPLGERIVRIETVHAHYTANQFFRVLEI
jgi:hypothetical protein